MMKMKWVAGTGFLLFCAAVLGTSSDAGLIYHLNFDERDSDAVADSSPIRNLPGRAFNASRTEGISGGALVFPGKNSYATLSLPGSFYEPKGLTYDLWFNADRLERGYILTCNNTLPIFIRIRNAILEVGVNADRWREIQCPEAVKSGQWYHLVVAIGDGKADCYLNGNPVGTIELPPTVRLTNKLPVYLGRSWFTEKDMFAGKIDDLKIYDRKLSAAEAMGMSPAELEKRELGKRLDSLEEKVLRKCLTEGVSTPSDLVRLRRDIGQYPQNKKEFMETLSKMEQPFKVSEKKEEDGLAVYRISPTSSMKILPDTVLEKTGLEKAGSVSIIAAPGEYEAASIVVRSDRVRPGFEFSVDIPGIPAAAIDRKYVLCWKQDGGAWTLKKDFNIPSVPVPELLVNDPEFLTRRFDQEPPLKTKDGKSVLPIRDAGTLRAASLPAGFNRQLLITVQVPPNTSPGLYRGKIKFNENGKCFAETPLNLRVLPFVLSTPRTRYDSGREMVFSVYSWSEPSDQEVADFENCARTDRQFKAEMEDLAAHGISSPLFIWNLKMLFTRPDLTARGIKMARDAGMCMNDIYFGASGNTDAETPEQLKALRERTEKLVKHFRSIGIKGDVYLYGRDEKAGKALARQLPAMRTIQSAGGKTIVSGFLDAFEITGKTLDLCNRYGVPDREEAALWHGQKKRVWNYGAPQAGEEDPAIYRKNFGLRLWAADFDGCADYCYIPPKNSQTPNPYSRSYRFVYQTVDGVIRTLAWDGFREAVDDVRYLSTLQLRAEAALHSSSPEKCAAAKEALAFLKGLDSGKNDPEWMRLKAMDYLLQLH